MSRNFEILDCLSDGAVVVDRDYKIVFMNKTMLDICGFKSEDVTGRNCYEIFHCRPAPYVQGQDINSAGPDVDDDFLCPYQEVFSKGRQVRTAHVHYSVDGDEKTFQITASPLKDEKGRVIEMVEMLRELTEKEKTMKAPGDDMSSCSEILEGFGEGVIVVDRDFRLITANRSYCSRAGMTLDEIKGRHCYEVLHQFDRPCYEKGEDCSVKHVFEKGKRYMSVHTHYDKYGKPFYVEINSYPVKDSDGRITAAIETVNSVTESVSPGDTHRGD